MVTLKRRLIISFLRALFSDWCWRLVGINWDLSIPLLDRLQLSKASFGTSAIFMEIIIVVAWCIWSVRNGIICYGAVCLCGAGNTFVRSSLLQSLGGSPHRNLLLGTDFLFFSFFLVFFVHLVVFFYRLIPFIKNEFSRGFLSGFLKKGFR